ncbi:hypothetical protein Scep_016055 [Stephania cephalantha]|uniref:Uncharacterized protein n=1 Tax=Stephania cephalantha TaxID=152367 RepID=A0AAP0INU0_9MAGN
MRLLKLAKEKNNPDCKGLGDIVLFGNEVRMRMKDYYAWQVLLRMEVFGGFHDNVARRSYSKLHCPPGKNEGDEGMRAGQARKDKQMNGDFDDDDNDDDEEEISFHEYVSNEFKQIKNKLSICLSGLCNNVPSTCISEVVEDINQILALLDSVETLLNEDIVSDEELSKICSS